MMSGKQIGKLMADLHPEWDQSRYEFLMEKFGISLDRKIHELSRGMSMKIQVAVELSHGADLVILDEATAGMDPASRDESWTQ
jgi:ABC-2 type transport system ATP-binding protein